MRVALIATGERGAAPSPIIAGRSLVLRQFDFARACGVERVIAYGNGAQGDAPALQQAAERAGIAHAAIASAHALIALVDWADELLVLQPGLLPEAGIVIEALGKGGKVLAFSAALTLSMAQLQTQAQRLERIDGETFWAGALVLPGALVDRLEQLPEDADPHAALLRIALQSHLPVELLSTELLADGRWTRVRSGADAAALGAERMRRLALSGPGAPPSRRLAELVLARFAEPLTERTMASAVALALALAALGGGVVSAWLGFVAGAFAGIALSVPLIFASRLLERLGRAAFESTRIPRGIGRLPDIALLVVSVLTLEGPWYRRLFPPLVLLGALQAPRISQAWRRVAGDRGVGALFVSLATLLSLAEPALMAWALLAMAAALLPPDWPRQR